MVPIAFLMAESSSLLRAPFRNWFGWCFTTRLFRGVGVGVDSTVVGEVDGVGSGVGPGVVDTRRIIGVEFAVVAEVSVGADGIAGGCQIILSET